MNHWTGGGENTWRRKNDKGGESSSPRRLSVLVPVDPIMTWSLCLITPQVLMALN